MMRPPTLPHPNPSAETVRPVLPRLRDSMARCPFAHPTRSPGTICRRSRCCQVSVMVSKSQPGRSSGRVGGARPLCAARSRECVEAHMTRSYVTENSAQRARLRELVDRLTDAELARPLDAGWTVAAVLAHVAFWDQRALTLIERWERDGRGSTPRPIDGNDVDWINDSAKALCLALPPRAAARLAVATSEAVDRRDEGRSRQHVAAHSTAGPPINLLPAQQPSGHLPPDEDPPARNKNPPTPPP